MNWYYAINQQQKGPVSKEEFHQLVSQGTVTPETLVWQEGMPQWVPFRQSPAAGAAQAPSMPPVPGAPINTGSLNSILYCSECGQSFPTDQVVRIGSRYSCAACKPVVIQKLQEGGRFQTGEGLSPDELKAGDYDSGVIDCITRGFRTYMGNFFPIIGTSMLVFLVLMTINFIPFLSIFLSLFLTGPLLGGYWLYMTRRASNEPTSVGDAFGGFSIGFLQLMLANIVSGILIYVPLLPGLFLLVVGLFAGGDKPNETIMIASIVTMALGFPVMMYLSIAWFFTIPLIIDKRMAFWPAMGLSRAMIGKHWWSTFGIGFMFWFIIGFMIGFPIAILIAMEGSDTGGLEVLVFGVMLFSIGLVGPWLFAAYAHRYNDIFKPMAVQNEF